VKVQWADRALQDLEESLDYLNWDHPGAARRLHDRVFEKTDKFRDFPSLGTILIEAGEPFREILAKPLRILYLHEDETVTIVAVFREEANLRSMRRPG
jgi:plasmid stabilization system protein ParE